MKYRRPNKKQFATQICTNCKLRKNKDQFGSDGRGGKRARCKRCHSVLNIQAYEAKAKPQEQMPEALQVNHI